MWKYRIALGLALFGLAAICALLGSRVPAVFWTLALWFGAASFIWQGSRAFLGKIGAPRAQPTALPHSPTRPHSAPAAPTNPGEVWLAVKSAADKTGPRIVRCYIVLGLVVLVPATLGLAIGGIVTLFNGDALQGGIMCALAGYLGWYLCVPLLALWWELDEADERAADETDSSAEPEQASLQQMHPNWTIIWSPWRQTFTAFPMANNAMLIEDPSARSLSQRILEIECAPNRPQTQGKAERFQSPMT